MRSLPQAMQSVSEGYFSVAVIKHHASMKQLMEEFILAYDSRGTGIQHDSTQQVWQQEWGTER